MTQDGNFVAGILVGGPGTLDCGAGAYTSGSPLLIDDAATAARAAFAGFSASNRDLRADLLDLIADKIEAVGAALTTAAMAETGLPEARLIGERGRTCGQLRLFASHIRDGAYLDRRHDSALPDRVPMARPNMRMMQRPVGPVAVFGASNFPLAFSVAGGDTASALAAGCPVVVKGHPAHPATSAIVAQAVTDAVAQLGLDGGVFSMVQDGGMAVGQALVSHPDISAVGFTGSTRGGRALFDLCATRPTPIPFFGELGSVNPVFILPHALSDRGADIGAQWAASLTMGAGQFCTNPGVIVLIEGKGQTAFTDAATDALRGGAPQTMLTTQIATTFHEGASHIGATPGVRTLVARPGEDRASGTYLYETDAETWLKTPSLSEEVFGPMGLIIHADSAQHMRDVAQSFAGQLTATLQIDAPDHALASQLLPTLETFAGRVLANGYPTGVEVADAMVHGGPYPASTNFGATSVGTMAIRRWLRPVCYQNLPTDLLPIDLR